MACTTFSCEKVVHALFFAREKEQPKNQSDFFFRIPEMDMNIITSKRVDAQFYVMFSNIDTIAFPSDSIDYIKFVTAEMGPINIIMDPRKRNDIYILNDSRFLEKVHPVNYNLHLLESVEFDSLFFEPRIRTNPLVLKYPFIHVGMASNTYTIWINKYKSVQETIKEGDIYGGW